MTRTLSDPLSQYIALRQYYARKSTDDASTDDAASSSKAKAKAASKPVARIAAECSRVYWPGQEVSATISIDEAALGSEGALEELVAEVKGEIHSFIYVYTSTGAPIPSPTTIPIFSHSVVLFSRSGSAEAPSMYAEPVAPTAEGSRSWQVRTALPLTFTADEGNEYALPPTFKDNSSNPSGGDSSFVVYSIKAVAKRGATFKRDSRTWIPILVTSLAGQSLNPASLVMPPPVAAPGAMPALPIEWQSLTATQVIKKALLRNRGELEAQLYSPPLTSVSPGTPIPFLLRLVVRTKSQADATASSGIIPALPLDGSGNSPTFKFKRLVRNRTKKAKFGTSKLEFTTKLPVHVDWSRAHLEASAISTSSQESAVAGPGHGWTACAHDSSAASFPYYTTALLSGFMSIPLSPSFELPTLSVIYTLRLNIPLDGLRNNLDEELGVVRAGSGVTQAELASLDVAEASRRAVGTRRVSLLQTLNNMQGDEQEVQKLGEMDKLPEYGDDAEESWIDEKSGKAETEKEQSHDLPEYDEAVDGMAKVKLADQKR